MAWWQIGTNGSPAFIWKLCSYWSKGLWHHQITVVILIVILNYGVQGLVSLRLRCPKSKIIIIHKFFNASQNAYFWVTKFCVKSQRAPLKFHTKFEPIHRKICILLTCFFLWFTISLNCDVISLSEMAPPEVRHPACQCHNYKANPWENSEQNITFSWWAIKNIHVCILHFRSQHIHLTFNVWRPSYLGLTWSISWLLMPWLLASPGHQQPWLWLRRISRFLSNLRKDVNYLCYINVREWHKK